MSDYLWDKSEQADPEIEQLEEILGSLRMKPRPLILPERLSKDALVSRRSSQWLKAAIAAILIVLTGTTFWMSRRTPVMDSSALTQRSGTEITPTRWEST